LNHLFSITLVADFSYLTSDNANIDNVQTRVEVLWRTLVADTFNAQHPAPPECGKQFLAHVSSMVLKAFNEYKYGTKEKSLKDRLSGRMHAFLYQNFNRSIKEKKIAPLIKLFDSEPPTSCYGSETFIQSLDEVGGIYKSEPGGLGLGDWARPFEAFRQELGITFASRLLFRTDTGLLGVGPLELDIGAEVWILAGANTPAVLREGSTGKKQFLGEAYAHGVMHGEALELGLDFDDIILE
jgi:hypothetical protein